MPDKKLSRNRDLDKALLKIKENTVHDIKNMTIIPLIKDNVRLSGHAFTWPMWRPTCRTGNSI